MQSTFDQTRVADMHSISCPISSSRRRPAYQQAAQLVIHDLLFGRHRRGLVTASANTDRDITPLTRHVRLGGQVVVAANLDIRRRQDGDGVDPRHDKLELARIGAVARDGGHVDIQKGAIGQVGRAGIQNGIGQVQRQVGVHGAGQGNGHRVPGGAVVSQATEGETRNALVRGIAGGADSA